MSSTSLKTAPPSTVRAFVRFLETGEPAGIFARNLRSDFNFPYSRMQETTADAVIALRRSEHPGPTEVQVERLDLTDGGWVLQFEERWDRGGQSWYGRVLVRADVEDGRIVELCVFDTGDWDETKQREYAARK